MLLVAGGLLLLAVVALEVGMHLVEAMLARGGRSLVPAEVRERAMQMASPHHPGVYRATPDANPHEVNDHGFRAPALHARVGNTLRVLVLGDEATFGLGAPTRESWPVRFGEKLRHDLELGIGIEVWNLAIPRASSWGNRRDLERWGDRLEPDIVVLAWSAANDAAPALRGVVDADRTADEGAFRRARWPFLTPHVVGRLASAVSSRHSGDARVSPEQAGENLRAIESWSTSRGVPLWVVLMPSPDAQLGAWRDPVSASDLRVLAVGAEDDVAAMVFDALLEDVLHQATLRLVDKSPGDAGPSF